MTLPTRSIFSGATPSRLRLSSASGDGVHSRSEIASVTSRLISSGIVRSPLRSPASRWASVQAQFFRDQRASGGGVDVADDDDPGRTALQAYALISQHDAGGLLGMRPGTDAEMQIGRRQSQLAPEHVRHLRVVMLAGMDQHRASPARRLQLMKDRRDLHEIRPCRRDQMDFRQRASELPSSRLPLPAAQHSVVYRGITGDAVCPGPFGFDVLKGSRLNQRPRGPVVKRRENAFRDVARISGGE